MDDELKKILVQIMEGQERFGLDLGELKSELRKNTETIVNLEDKMMERTKALFDGYKANTEKLEELNEKIDDLRLDVNNLNIKTTRNDSKIIELDRKINSK